MSFGVERKTTQPTPLNGMEEKHRNQLAFENFLKKNKISLDSSILLTDKQLLEEFFRLRRLVLEGKDPHEVAKSFETMVREVYPQEEEEEKFYRRMAKSLSLITKFTSNQ
jgi:hypothetical protein